MSPTVLPTTSDELDGVWASVGIVAYGEEIAGEDIPNGRLTIADGVATVWNATRQGHTYRVHMRLRPDCSPKEMDCTQLVVEGETPFIDPAAGIYELDGDRLTCCTNGAASSWLVRPTGFGPEHIVTRFTRIRTGETS